MEKACVIGYGIVGQATAEVLGIDKHFDIHDHLSNISLEEAAKCRLVFICLPTPVDREGNYLLDDLKALIRQLESYETGCIYIIRSTVVPGFALAMQKELGIVRMISNPEFLSADTAVEDMKNPPFIIIGGLEGAFRDEVRAFYEARIKGAPVIITDNNTAEMLKLTLNTFFALKVIFANQVYDACELLEANYSTIKEALEKHPFGSKNHFQVWFKNKRGVNGACLPKDSKAFANYTNAELVKVLVRLNDAYISQSHDISQTYDL